MTAKQELELLREQLAAEKAKNAPKPPGPVTLKVSEKGGLSVYGLGRFPVTLYPEQWSRIFATAPEIVKFIAANAGAFKAKKA